jgi:hypothetical protein
MKLPTDRLRSAVLAALLMSLASAPAAFAQASGAGSGAPPPSSHDETRFSVGASLGFSDSPGAASLGFEAPIEITHNLALGPFITLGLAENLVELAASFDARYSFDLADTGNLSRLRPFVQGGVGISYINDDGVFPKIDEANFLLNCGIGLEYAIDEHMALTSQAMFNVVPYAPRSRTFYPSVQLLGLRYRF